MGQQSSMRGGRSRKFKAEINVVPYIDVMLVLLVIFMVVAPLTPPNSINLPKAGRSTQPPTDYIEVELKADGAASVACCTLARPRKEFMMPHTVPNRPT